MTPRRAASWLYDVVNVLWDAFEAENHFLERGNSTWRFYNEQLEFILGVGAYLGRNQQHILRDFLMNHPAFEGPLSSRDVARNELARAASVVYREAKSDPRIHDAVARAREAFLAQHPSETPTGAFRPEQHVDLVIERLINEIDQLPSHYTDAAFWAAHRHDFAWFNPPSRPALVSARERMRATNMKLIEMFNATSVAICERYDIPAAPSGTVTF